MILHFSISWMTYDSPPVPCIVLTFQQHFRVVWFGESMVMTCIKVCSLAICCPRTEIWFAVQKLTYDTVVAIFLFLFLQLVLPIPSTTPWTRRTCVFLFGVCRPTATCFSYLKTLKIFLFFDTVTNSATESITKVPRPGKFDMRLACRAHLLRWALTQGCGTKGQEILAALTHGLTVYVKFLTHVWKGQYLNIVLYRSSGIGLYINIIMFDKTMLTHF